jgi:tRNA(Arg) A34 adenosine deaminase TadA
MILKDWDEECIREAIRVARSARAHGNHPFGALLADQKGNILLTAENSVVIDRDCTAHAETNLVRKACQVYESDFLSACTIYASTEPCPMCTGAIFWANIRRVVFGLSEERLYTLTGGDTDEVLYLPCREVLARGKKDIEVIGPLLENEALDVHIGFWKE